MFYGREKQKKTLLNMFEKEEQMISLIYGRRRVGKSELIKQSLKETDVQSIYYECKQTTERNNVESLSDLVSEAFGYPELSFADIEDLLNFIFKKAEEKSLILVLDEYPYLRENVKGLDSIIQ